MPSFLRIGTLACFSLPLLVATGPSASAQDRKQAGPDARKGVEVDSPVEGPIPIISLKPNGSRVEKGELVCELEAFPLKEKLSGHEGDVKVTESAYKNALTARELAEDAVQEYLEGTYKQEIQTLNGRIALAEVGLQRAQKRLESSRRLYEKKIVPRERVSADEVGVQRARLALEQVQGKKQTLEKFTKEKKVKILQSEVEKARSVELTRQAAFEREKTVQDRLTDQIAKCKVFAPATGRLVYSPPIEPAAEVVKGQLLFRIIPEDEPKPKEGGK